MKRISALKLLGVVFAFILSSCVSEKQISIASKTMTDNVFSDIVPLVKFDPYLAKIHFDEYEIANKIQSIRYKSMANGGCDFQIKWVRCEYVSNDLQTDAWWDEMCLQLRNKGWGITQRDFTKGALNHGEYTVPCELILNVYYGFGKGATKRFHFNVSNQDLSTSKLGRIGITYNKSTLNDWTKNKLVVINTVANAPADKAGIKINDVITHVNNIAVDNLTLEQASDLFKGDVGESITITIVPSGLVVPHDVTMIREGANSSNTSKPSNDIVAPKVTPKADVTPTEKLKQLKELYDGGFITKEEYDQKRKEILNGL